MTQGDAKVGDRASVRDLLTFAAPHRAAIAAALMLGMLAALAALTQPLAVSSILRAVRTGDSVAGPAALLAALFTADAVLSGFQGYILGRTGEGIVFGLRRALVARLLRMPVAEHDRRRAGDLLSRVSTDTTLLKTSLAQSVTGALVGVVVFVGAVILMAVIDPLLLGVALLCVLAATAGVLLVASKVRAATEEAQKSLGALGAALERALRAVRTLKISRAEIRETAAISAEAGAAYHAGVRATAYESLVGPATNVALQGSFILVLGVGGARLASGDLALEELVAFLLYLLYLVGPLALVFMAFTELQQGLAAVGRINEMLAVPAEGSTERPADGQIADATSIENAPVARLDRVSFGYVPGRLVLEDVSLEIPGPGVTALVGPSGAGKSTIFSLLVRFYEADSGSVEVDGTDVRRLPLNDLRGRVAYVEQESPVLAGTIRQNLRYAAPEATEEELEEVLRLTNLRSLVDKLPRGLDTEAGDGGVLLSGGERQRIALARMLLAKPRLLLLDEVTSQLDAANERALKATISGVSRRCAVAVIAHRLSTVADADRILVLDDGRVQAAGTHEELLATNALYERLVQTQLIGARNPVEDTASIPGKREETAR